MLKFLKRPLVRSSAVLALLGGMAAWNFKSTADAECFTTCFSSAYVWLRYRNTCSGLDGSYVVATFPDGFSKCHPAGGGEDPCVCWFKYATAVNWQAKCPICHSTVGIGFGKIPVCVGFFPPCRGARWCPCSGCECLCVAPQKTWYNVSSLEYVYTPSGCVLAWGLYHKGLCLNDD